MDEEELKEVSCKVHVQCALAVTQATFYVANDYKMYGIDINVPNRPGKVIDILRMDRHLEIREIKHTGLKSNFSSQWKPVPTQS